MIENTKQIYFFDCGGFQGKVIGIDLEDAQQTAVRYWGTRSPITNMYIATTEEIAVRKAMGGTL